MALSWEELDALITETLANGPRTGPNPFGNAGPWDCVDDEGNPRTVRTFDPRHAVEDDDPPPADGPLVS